MLLRGLTWLVLFQLLGTALNVLILPVLPGPIIGLVLLFVNRIGMLGLSAPLFDGSLLAPVMLRWWLVVAAALPPELGIPRHL